MLYLMNSGAEVDDAGNSELEQEETEDDSDERGQAEENAATDGTESQVGTYPSFTTATQMCGRNVSNADVPARLYQPSKEKVSGTLIHFMTTGRFLKGVTGEEVDGYIARLQAIADRELVDVLQVSRSVLFALVRPQSGPEFC
jgi:hypothetical protein